MAIIKSYTDLEQSNKLAEFLPLESADMHYGEYCVSGEHYPIPNYDDDYYGQCCWSLAALHSVLPMITKGKDTANPFIAKTSDNEYYVVYATLTKEIDSSGIYDNPVDACYEMIIKLHELKML